MDKNAFIEKLLDTAKRAGFEACEAYLSEGSSFETEVFRGEITGYSVAESLNLGFRGLVNGRMGCASTQVLDAEAAEMLVSAAKGSAELCETDDAEFIFSGSERYPEPMPENPALAAMTNLEKIELARTLEREAQETDSRIASTDGCGVFSSASTARLVNSRGLELTQSHSGMGLYIAPVARSGERSGTGARQFFTDDPSTIDARRLAREAAQEALDFLNAESIESGSYRILLRNDMAATLLGVFSGIFSADSAQKGLSLLKGREGECIAAPAATIIDDPLIPGSPTSIRFDGEGVAARRKAVVEDGRLNTLLHNLKTARRQGVETTANARRATCAGPMTVAPSSFFFAPSALSRDALISNAGRALLITELMGMHSGANAVSGDFSLGAKGYLIENGRIARPVNQITIAGSYFSLLRDVEAAADDLAFGAPGGSRFGSPMLRIKSLSVAGK